MKYSILLPLLAFSFQVIAGKRAVNRVALVPSDKAVVMSSAGPIAKGAPCTTGGVRSFPHGTVLVDGGHQYTCDNGQWKGNGLN